MSLLKEFASGDFQQDLKNADSSAAGKNDLTTKPVDVKFNLMRNMINTNGTVTGSTVNDYLERAHDLNDEVDTVGFAIETDNGDLIKVYVNAQQADEFEEECSKLLGLDDDSESAINTLAQKFDIIDVVWPQDPNAGSEEETSTEDPYDSVSIDDDLSGFMDDDTVDQDDTSNSDDSQVDSNLENALPADDEDDEVKPKKKKSLMKDIAGDSEEEESSEDEDGSPVSDAKKKEPKASADDEESSEESNDQKASSDDASSEDDESFDDEEELDDEGNPVKKEKKKKDGDKEIAKESLLLKNLSNLVENLRDDVNAHVAGELAKRADKSSKFVVDCLMTGGTLGRRQYLYQEDGDVKYFDTMEEAEDAAKALTAKRNHTMARATYKFTARAVKEEDEMIGSNFLKRISESQVSESTEPSTIKDTVWNGIHNRMKRPYDKKIVEFFSLLDIPGRYVRGEEGLEDAIRAGGDVIRRAGRKQTAFNALFDLLKGSGSGPVTEAKKGSRLQKILETVMVKLGFPETLVSSSEMPGPLNSMLRRAAAKMEANSDMEAALITLAKAIGITTAELNEGKALKVREPGWYVVDHMDKAVDGPYSEGNAKKEAKQMSKEYAAKHGKGDMAAFDAIYFSDYDIKQMNESSVGSRFLKRVSEEVDVGQDDFMESVMALVLALGIPEAILQPRRQMIIRALREKKQTLTNRGMLQQRMQQLIGLIQKGTKAEPSTGTVQECLDDARVALTEQALFEAFGPLEAVVGKSLEYFNADEPAAGPAMMASYEGSGAHEDTVLVLAVDPDADDDNKSLRVGIDSPWDGGIHAKYFANNKEGYKAAVDYANMLRTCNLKKGGRPKGWKEDPMQRGRNAAEMGRGPSAKDFE